MLNFVGPPALTVNITENTESSSIVVQWDEVDDSLTTTYIVTWSSERNHITHHVTLIEQSSYTLTGLTLDTVYTITVTAANRCGQGPEYRTSTSFILITSTISSISPTTTTTTTTTPSMTSTTIPTSIAITTAVTSSSITTTTILMTNPSGTTTNSFTTTVSRIASTTTNLHATITTTTVEDSSIVTVTTTITNNLCTYIRPSQINVMLHGLFTF